MYVVMGAIIISRCVRVFHWRGKRKAFTTVGGSITGTDCFVHTVHEYIHTQASYVFIICLVCITSEWQAQVSVRNLMSSVKRSQFLAWFFSTPIACDFKVSLTILCTCMYVCTVYMYMNVFDFVFLVAIISWLFRASGILQETCGMEV